MNEDTKQANSLASELLHEIKATSRRWFVLFLITLLLLFGTNMAWLYAWNLPVEETAVTQELDNASHDNYIDGVGDIDNGGTSDNTQD